ncbi:MAG TPA: hypothetical protein VH281_03630 [Gaiellaceae bacterium]|jgi:hypothetical protein
MRIHSKQASLALVISLSAICLAAVGVLAACGGNAATGSTTASPPGTPPTSTPQTTTTDQQSFVSDLYGYSVDSWTGTSAQTAWDGTGSPGDGDPMVDSLSGPEYQRAFAFGEPTKDALKKFVAKFRVADSKVHPCPVKPEASTRTTIDGEPAIVVEEHCPAGGGPFVLQAFTTHAGQVYVFFTYDQSAKEAEMREWFGSLLQGVAFSA